MSAVFPMHEKPYLKDWLTAAHKQAIQDLVAVAVEEHGGAPPQDPIVAKLRVEPIRLGNKYIDDKPWVRKMTAQSSPDSQMLRRGVRPGDSYTQSYDVYRVEVESGLDAIKSGVSGGRQLDPMFVFTDGGHIVIRAADDIHRDDQLATIEGHVSKANTIINEWNTKGLPADVKREIAREVAAKAAENQRQQALKMAGFTPTPPGKPRRLRLSERKRKRTSPRKSPGSDGIALHEESFEAILDCIASYREVVERHPGAGPDPSAPEEEHRDGLLLPLNLLFESATGETFSKKGKTDIRVEVGDHTYFYAECKIWSGPATVSEAVEQLDRRYLIYRDSHGAIVLFVRDLKRPGQVAKKAVERLVSRHQGQRLDDIHGIPTVKVETTEGRPITIAVVVIVVDSAPPRA